MGIATASYGGHYGPEIVRHIQGQNEKPPANSLEIAGLAIDDGLFNYRIQQKAMADYAHDKGIIDDERTPA